MTNRTFGLLIANGALVLLAGFAVGAVERDGVLPRSDLKPGDVLLGLASSGFHSYGYSLVRRIVEDERLSWSAPFPGGDGANIAQTLLTPTRIYVRSLLSAIRETHAVKAMAHITGGGFVENIPRVLPDGLAEEVASFLRGAGETVYRIGKLAEAESDGERVVIEGELGSAG